MRVYGAAMCVSNRMDEHRHDEWPYVNNVLAVRLTYGGIDRWLRKVNVNKEICEHLIWIEERDDFEAVDVEIEVVHDTRTEKGVIPEVHAKVKYSVKNKHTGKIELADVRINVIICPIFDMTI